MNRRTFAEAFAWFVFIMATISTLPSNVQRELHAALQRLEVPAMHDPMPATQNGRAILLMTLAGTMLLNAVDYVRARLTNARNGRHRANRQPQLSEVLNQVRHMQRNRDILQRAYSSTQTQYANTRAELNEVRNQLGHVQRNRDTLQEAYVREFVHGVVTRALENELDGRLAKHIATTKATIDTHTREVARLRQERNANVQGMLRSLGVALDRERALEKELVALQRRMATAHRAMSNLEPELYKIAARLETLEATTASLRNERNQLQAEALHNKKFIDELKSDVMIKEKALHRAHRLQNNMQSLIVTQSLPRRSQNRMSLSPSTRQKTLRRTATM